MRKFILIVMLALTGCQSAERQASPPSSTTTAPPAEAKADNDRFSVHIAVPRQVQINEPFKIDVELMNKTDREFNIMTGKPVFYYVIRDSSGRTINAITRNDIGVVRPMTKNEALSEQQQYRFRSPGIYEITAVARFTVQDGGSGNDYMMETDAKQIRVVEPSSGVGDSSQTE